MQINLVTKEDGCFIPPRYMFYSGFCLIYDRWEHSLPNFKCQKVFISHSESIKYVKFNPLLQENH